MSKFSPFLLKNILNLLLTDDDFRDRFFPILKPSHFDIGDGFLLTFVRTIWKLEEQYNKFPSDDIIIEELFTNKGKNIDIFDEEPSEEELEGLKSFFISIYELQDVNKKYIEDNLTKILSYLAIQKIVQDNRDELRSGTLDVELFTQQIAGATTFASPLLMGKNLLEDLDERTEDRLKDPIVPGSLTFPIPALSSFLEGGKIPPGSLCYWMGATGGGKALSIDTKIPTPNGWSTMGSLTVGDYVFSDNGLPCKVVWKSEVFFEPTYKLNFSDGSFIIAGENHEWVTQTAAERSSYERRAKNKFKVQTGRYAQVVVSNKLRTKYENNSIKTTKEIFETCNVLKDLRHNHSITLHNPIELPEAPLLIDPYVLGAWLGDGTSISGDITGIDNEIFEEIEKAGYRITYKNRPCHNIVGLITKLRAIGVYGNKHIPSNYLRGSIKQRLALVQGLMDTDGYCNKYGQIEFINTNLNLVEGLKELLNSLGIKVTIRKGKATLYGRVISDKYLLKFVTSLPMFRISRKLNRQKRAEFKGTHNKVYILSVEKIEPVPLQCIQVDAYSHCYLAGESWITTHNSMALTYVAKEAAFLDKVNVLYVTAELTEDLVKQRLDACITGVPTIEIRAKAKKVRDIYHKSPSYTAIASRIQVIEVPMGTTTVSELNAVIERLEKVKGFKTEVLVVDYADVLAASKRQKEFRHNLTAIYTELKELARNRHIVVWTASQFNAEGTKEALKENSNITTTHGNESSAKSHYADMVIGIARTKDEIDNGAARLIIVKNRIGGGQGFTLKVFPDLSRARLFTGRSEAIGSVDVEKPIDGLDVLDDETQDSRIKSYRQVYDDEE